MPQNPKIPKMAVKRNLADKWEYELGLVARRMWEYKLLKTGDQRYCELVFSFGVYADEYKVKLGRAMKLEAAKDQIWEKVKKNIVDDLAHWLWAGWTVYYQDTAGMKNIHFEEKDGFVRPLYFKVTLTPKP